MLTTERERAGAERIPWRVLGGHVALLAVVLLVGMWFVDPTISFSADEGAVIAQVDAISDGSWVRVHPVPEVDDVGRWFPLEFPVVAADGAASYVKHPLYPLALVPLDALGGVRAMVALSVAGTVLAALAAALLAARLRPALTLPALWLAGVGSPLVFDGYLVIAHTLGAACVGWAAFWALRTLESRRAALSLAVAMATLSVGVLLRSEVLFVGPALAVGAWFWDRSVAWRRRVTVAVALVGASVFSYVLDGWWSRWVLGEGGGEPFTIGHKTNLLSSRVNGLVNTWLVPSDGEVTLGVALRLAVPVCLVLLAIASRRRPIDEIRLRFLAITISCLSLIGLVLSSTTIIPGLLVAFPLVLLIVPWLGELWASRDHRLLLTTAGIASLLVLATQYERGGTAEWGGRYFAMVLPLVVPAVIDVAERTRRVVAPSTARILAWTFVLVPACLALGAVLVLRSAHERTEVVVEGVMGTVLDQSDSVDPVVVSIAGIIPRLSWAHLDEARWLLVPSDELSDLFTASTEAGLEELFVVTPDRLPTYADDTGEFSVVSETTVYDTWTVTRLTSA